jgi:hypothetical protein|nr:MAG TPA: hypothetical protein [Bacteriophage sp.]
MLNEDIPSQFFIITVLTLDGISNVVSAPQLLISIEVNLVQSSISN